MGLFVRGVAALALIAKTSARAKARAETRFFMGYLPFTFVLGQYLSAHTKTVQHIKTLQLFRQNI